LQQTTLESLRGYNPENKGIVVEKNYVLKGYNPGPVPLAEGDLHKTWIYPKSEKYAERKYQLEIARSAILHNTLVSLPTGLGKTLIASVVMYNFYRWFPGGKVVFLAPTRPLVRQQIEACYNVMGIPERDTAEISGTIKDREKLWRTRRVFFCTPQACQRDIENGLCNAKLIVCLVLDEAHKTTKKYAYNVVLQYLHESGAKARIVSAYVGRN
jgi:ERCC4-related helicase